MDNIPIYLGLLLIVVAFVAAMNRGVVKFFSSGLALGFALVSFGLALMWIPALLDRFLDIELEWRKSAWIGAGVALVAFIAVRIVGGFLVKESLGPGSWLHSLSDGVGGGILSLFPAVLTVLFLFGCLRVAGTVLELNYLASISREGISSMGGNIPPYPLTARWRNSTEAIPGVAPLLDRIDPFSNRANRNAAAFVLMGQSSLVRSHLLARPETADLAADETLIELIREPVVHEAVESQDRVDLVLSPPVRNAASDSELEMPLRRLVLRPAVESFVDSLKPAPRNTFGAAPASAN